jgi:hypothetical protein
MAIPRRKMPSLDVASPETRVELVREEGAYGFVPSPAHDLIARAMGAGVAIPEPAVERWPVQVRLLIILGIPAICWIIIGLFIAKLT